MEEQLAKGNIVPTTNLQNSPLLVIRKPRRDKWQLLHNLRERNKVIEDMGSLQPWCLPLQCSPETFWSLSEWLTSGFPKNWLCQLYRERLLWSHCPENELLWSKNDKQDDVHSTESEPEKSLGLGSRRGIYTFTYPEGSRQDLREGSNAKERLQILQFWQQKVTNGNKDNSELSCNNLHNWTRGSWMGAPAHLNWRGFSHNLKPR